ncbi:ATP-binding protein [Methanobrevibacter boviskoreani]|uniref:NOP5/NOP56 family protein n=1 Tax=Methanobrevibacter boviskoreani TaxID=1348249 RepID=UPI002A91E979|nr:ATP-binding protein [Methanobrevibacter boviskoreani]MDY5615278.1 ATP-binding protein [Methanobrevibacter boviskoreani]
MEIYITNCIAGFLSFDSNLKLIDYTLFKDDEAGSKLHDINRNILTSEEISLIEKTPDEYDEIIVETSNRHSDYSELKNYEKIRIKRPNKGGEYLRAHLLEILQDINFVSSPEEYNEKLTNISNQIAILKMKESSQKEDKVLIQAVNAIDEVDEEISKLIERLREWETIYFPEIETLHNNETYVKLIVDYDNNREKIIENNPELLNNIQISNGADLKDEDIEIINGYARSIMSLQNTRSSMEKYIEDKMEKIAPNLKDLLGATLGAKLIAHAGSIKRLATYSASTIQIMGAEKALFRHLKTGENPPKHGLIYQNPFVRTSNYWNRGKIARRLASKITFAVRKDVFTDDINRNLKVEFEEEVEKIEKENPFPKPKSTNKNTNRRKSSKKSKHHKKTKKRRRSKRRKH